MKTIVSILAFGAISAASEPQTKAIQAAIDACFAQGGGEVQIPEGVFLSGGIRLRSNVCLHLMENAHLKGVRDPEAYGIAEKDELEPLPESQRTDRLYQRSTPLDQLESFAWMRRAGSRWNHGLVRAVNAANVAIIGEKGSVLDGSDCFDEVGEEAYRGPHLVNFFYCEGVTLRGYTCVDSANWAHALFFCRNIAAEDIRVIAGHDGIHATGCDNLVIQRCEFLTGDDCVAGFDNRNVLVSDCRMNTACSAMRFGGTNALIERCRFWGPAEYVFRGSLTPEEKRTGGKPEKVPGHRYNMLSVFTYYADFSMEIRDLPDNIVIRDCTAQNVDRFLHYNYSGNETWQKNRPLQRIMFENVHADGISMPLVAYGDPQTPVYLSLRNVQIAFSAGHEEMDFLQTCNYAQIAFDHVAISGLETGALVRSWGGDGELHTDCVTGGIPAENRLLAADRPFVCRPI